MATSAGDRTNFVRIGYAIIDKITPILRCILKKYIPPGKIQSKVTAKIVHINPDQRAVVQNSKNVPDYEDFDITLLYILIRNLCKVKEPTLTWGDCDLLEKGHITDGDDIERIRIIRNKVFGHTAKISISQNEFETYWSILEGVYSRLGLKFLPNYDKTDFIKVKTCPIDEEMEENMKKIEIELQDRVDNLEERIVDVEACKDVLNQNVKKLAMEMGKMKIEHVESDRRLDRLESEMRRMQSHGEFRSTTDMKTSLSDKMPMKFQRDVMQPGNTQGYFTYDSEERALQDAFGRIPDLKNSPAYIQWVVNLQNTCVPLLKISEREKAVRMYCEYLKIYRESLEINESIRGKYALKGLRNRLEREHLHKLYCVHLFDISVAIAKDLQRELTWLSSQQSAAKKDVDSLLNIVKERIAENENTSIIIFVKTRKMCTLLAKYMKSEGLEFWSLTGHTSGSEGHGTTPEKQLSILSDFKEGKIKGIISTTITEKGLDIQGCDCMILYKFAGNETSSKQAKGRIRERQGNSLLLGRQQHIMRDSLKLQRFVLMEHGLKQILNMQHTDLELEIKQLQHEIVLVEHMRREQIASQVKEESDLYALVCKRCVKNDIDCSKIRVIKGSHHVVIDRNIRNRIKTTPLKKSLNVDDCVAQSQWFHDECKYKQGTVFLCKGVGLPALSQSRFLYYHKNDPKKTTKDFKRWTELPFEFKEIREDDLSEMM